jgi:hypothetical protein
MAHLLSAKVGLPGRAATFNFDSSVARIGSAVNTHRRIAGSR